MALERQHVLSKKERAVMEKELDAALGALELDDYFDVTPSDKKGELVYCINMHRKGLAYARVEKAFKSNLKFKILLALAGGVCSGDAAWGVKLLIQQLSGL